MPTSDAGQDALALVCGADDRFAMPMAVTLFSALSCLPKGRAVRVWVVDGGIREEQRARLARVVAAGGAAATLEFARPDLRPLRGLPTPNGFTLANYLRLLIPEIVPPAFSRAVYLDSDLLVRLDLTNLWTFDMGGGALAAARDAVAWSVSHEWGLTNHAALGLPADAPYFNSGVLLFDLARWRREHLGARIIQYSRDQAAHIQWADQDGLNAVLAHDWAALPPRYNLLMNLIDAERWASEGERERAAALRLLLRGPCICHFSGRAKPWATDCRYPARFDWLRALWRSRWFTPAERARWFADYGVRYYGPRVRRRLHLGGG